MKKLPQISDAEFEVMDVIWKYAPITQTKSRIGWRKSKNGVQRRSIPCYRALRKRALLFTKRSRVFGYTPCVRKEDYIEAESRTLANRFFDGAMSQMVVNFLDQRDLSSEDLDELQCILDKKRKK